MNQFTESSLMKHAPRSVFYAGSHFNFLCNEAFLTAQVMKKQNWRKMWKMLYLNTNSNSVELHQYLNGLNSKPVSQSSRTPLASIVTSNFLIFHESEVTVPKN